MTSRAAFPLAPGAQGSEHGVQTRAPAPTHPPSPTHPALPARPGVSCPSSSSWPLYVGAALSDVGPLEALGRQWEPEQDACGGGGSKGGRWGGGVADRVAWAPGMGIALEGCRLPLLAGVLTARDGGSKGHGVLTALPLCPFVQPSPQASHLSTPPARAHFEHSFPWGDGPPFSAGEARVFPAGH